MRLSIFTLLLLVAPFVGAACDSDVESGDITIAICDSTLATEGVELIVGRAEGFRTPLPPGTRLEDYNGQSPDELIWQIPEPSGGWSELVEVNLDQLVGNEMFTARVTYEGGSTAVSASLVVIDMTNLRLELCQSGPDGGIEDANDDAGPEADAGIVQDDIPLTASAIDEYAVTPSMVSTGSELAVAWVDSRDGNDEIYFARFTGAGGLIESEVRVTNDAGKSNAPWLVWTGSDFAVAWHDDREGNTEIYFRRIGANGALVGTSPIRITTDAAESTFPSLVYNGGGYAIAWEDRRNLDTYQIYITLLDANGDDVTDDTRLTTTDLAAVAASLVWNGSSYALAWQDRRHGDEEIYFAEVDTDGALIGVELRVTDEFGRSSLPRLVWNDSGYAMVWEEFRNGPSNIYFVRLSSTGEKIGVESRVDAINASQRLPNMIWTGTDYALAWGDARFTNSEIMFAAINTSGALIGEATRLTDAADSSSSPSLARLSGETKIIWQDRRSGIIDLFFQASAP